MADKLTSLIEMFHYLKKSGRSATLTMSTKEGQATRVKLEVELDDATPRKILTVKKPAGCQPTFATLNLDGAPPPTTPLTTPPTLSHPSPPSSPPPPPLHISRQPPLCQAWYDHGHCKYCGRCSMLCVDHHGCYCEEEGVVHCDVCHCTKELRHLAPS